MTLRTTLIAGVFSALTIATAQSAPRSLGQVFVMTNAATGNAVEVFRHEPNGSLLLVQTALTNGSGSGAGLGTQGALALSDDTKVLFAVNAGSSEIASFLVSDSGLVFVEKVPSGGVGPDSIATRGSLVYTVNAGSANISGFTHSGGELTPIAGSSQPLSATNAVPGQIGFSSDGNFLVVTEKNTNLIDVYPIDDSGVAQPPTIQASTGQTPFGFAFTSRGRLVVSDAFGGVAGAGALTGYKLQSNGQLAVQNGAVPDHHAAPCWVSITTDGVHAYTTNTGDGTVSSYVIGLTGSLTLLTGANNTALLGSTSGPTDMSLSADGHFLFVSLPGNGSIAIIRVGAHGELFPVGTALGVPTSASGLVAR